MAVSLFLFNLCVLTAMSGFLFGYDTGIVSGSMIFIKDEMNLGTVWIELIVSSTIGFAWLFAWLSAFIVERMGRKQLIMIASLAFTLASLIMGAAVNKYMLLIGRAVAGAAIGLGSMIAPVYIAELSPKENRGSLVTFNSAFVTFGILASTLISYGFSYLPSEIGWRFMLGFAGIPSMIQLVGFYFMPESPRYLCLQGKDEEALAVMMKIHSDPNRAKEEIESIKASFNKNESKPEVTANGKSNGYSGKNGYEVNNNGFSVIELHQTKDSQPKQDEDQGYFRKLWEIMKDPTTRHCLILGICLHIGQQFSGINSIMYYGASVVQKSGVMSKRIAIWLTVFVGITNATTSFVALFFYDRVTRRKITLASMCGIVVCLALMGTMFVLVDKQQIPIYDLNDTYTENLQEINHCRIIQTCNGCIMDPKCGYCFDSEDMYGTGRCLPRNPSDELKSLNNTLCRERSNEDLGIYFTIENCPSDYGVPTVITLCLFLAWYAFGMGATPWSINAEMYPMHCRGVAVSFCTGFNWLFNLIVSISFLTITEYFATSGAFFLYMSVSVVLTIVFYLWLPETKNKSMEEDTMVFRH